MMGFGSFCIARRTVLAARWFIYWLFTRSGWRLTRQPAETHPPTESSSSKAENE
jgi:hypothetical protein